jgi:carnosine N-methyltransferase
VRYILKNLARDWSAEAAEERAQSHGPILRELEERLYVPTDPNAEGRYPPRVMVPGAGLGRLVLECARRGFEAEGNEHSYYMLLTSSFILNHCVTAGQFSIHPWMHNNNNHTSDANQMRAVPIPDATASDVMAKGRLKDGGAMSMCAGDFVEVYGAPEQTNQWDAVATCFFIDTAHNVVEYLEIIANCLKPGGVWVNFGPLLFHWSDARAYLDDDELSVEMSLADVERVAESVGLRIVKREMRDSLYTADKKSMCQTVYRCALLVAVRAEKT